MERSVFDLRIRGAKLLNGTRRDVGIVAGEIAAIAPTVEGEARTEIVADGGWLVPGLVDIPVTLGGTPESVRRESAAFLRAGVTTLGLHLPDALELDVAKLVMDSLAPRGAFVTSLSVRATKLEERAVALRALGPGIQRAVALSWVDLSVALARVAREFGRRRCVIVTPSEWTTSRTSNSAALEIDATQRLIDLAADRGTHLHFHAVSTAGAVDLIAEAKAAGIPITASVLASRLKSMGLAEEDSRSIDRERLVEAIVDGTIDCIASGRDAGDGMSPLTPVREYFEVLLALASTQAVDLATVFDRAAFAPARVFGLGRMDGPRDLVVSAPADLLLLKEAPNGLTLRDVFLAGQRIDRSTP